MSPTTNSPTPEPRHDVTEMPAFKSWFAGSKVTWDGRPLRVFHGTRSGFEQFEHRFVGQNFGDAAGFFFTNNTSHDVVNRGGQHREVLEDMTSAGAYAENAKGPGGPAIMPCYIKLLNPLVIDRDLDGGGVLSAIEGRSQPAGTFIRDEVIGQGYDGLIVIDRDVILSNGQPEILVVATRPDQIKSAIGNSGAFDPGDTRITASAKTATSVTLDLAWVDGLRKDFLTLMRNLPKVQNFEQANALRQAFSTFRTRFHDLIFERFLNQDLKHDHDLSPGRAEMADSLIRSAAWSFEVELQVPLDTWRLSQGDDTKEQAFRSYQRQAPKWEAALRRRAQAFWPKMRELLEFFGGESRSFQVDVPAQHTEELEGFPCHIQGYRPQDADRMEIVKAGLRRYRENASSYLPILLTYQTAIDIDFVPNLEKGGEYLQDHVVLYATAATDPEAVARILAHEMGHHMWRALDQRVTESWSMTVRGDYGELNLQELVQNWPGDAWAFQFGKVLGSTDPILALQVEALSHDRSLAELQRKDDFQQLIDRGRTTLLVPQTPITGYANKNPEEAFCEAIGMLVGYGPRAVHERVRHWLDWVLPERAKKASKMAAGDITEAPAFKSWFAGSQVIDAQGRPLCVFHGTMAAPFDTFRDGDSFGHGLMGAGSWFTSSPDDASSYATDDVTVNHDFGPKAEVLSDRYGEHGLTYEKAKDMLRGPGHVYPVYLAIKNPLVVGGSKLEVPENVFRVAAIEADVPEDEVPALYRRFTQAPGGVAQFEVLANAKALKVFRQVASLQNRDGLVVMPSVAPRSNGGAHFLVFRPEQVKSALANSGAFSPSDGRITASKTASTKAPAEPDHDPIQRRMLIQGFPIAIEYPAGSTKLGEDDQGNKWARLYLLDYGFIEGGPCSTDGETMDVYVGPHHGADYVYVVNQLRKDGTLDEHKVMMGFASQEQALRGYLQHYPADWAETRVGSVKPMTIMEFRRWLAGPGVMKAAKLKTAASVPQVKKIRSLRTDEGKFSVWDVDADHRRPDMFTVWEHPKGWVVRNVLIPEELRRRGIASRTYQTLNQLSLKATGHPLRSTQERTLLSGERVIELSDMGRALWDGFVGKGLAEPDGDTYRFKRASFEQPTPEVLDRVIQEVNHFLAREPRAARLDAQDLLLKSPTWGRIGATVPPEERRLLLKRVVLEVDSWLANLPA